MRHENLTTIEKEGENENDIVASLERVPVVHYGRDGEKFRRHLKNSSMVIEQASSKRAYND